MPETVNIARHLPLMAAQQPGRAALKIPRRRTAAGRIDYLTLTFAELDSEVDAWCERLAGCGVRRGDRTLVMVRQGLPLIASVFALFKMGAVPVVIDPGMGRDWFLKAVEHSRPRALIGVPLARLVSRVYFRAFRSVRIRVAASGSMTARLAETGTTPASFPLAPTAADELAAVLFTSGSTGVPKGVCYGHGMFEAQVRAIREAYDIRPGEVDLPLLPIFALFNPALGMTTVVPELDPRRPGAVDPAKIVQAIQQEKVTNSFGSPTLWHKIGSHCQSHGLTLPGLRRVLCAGAPVPASLWEQSRAFLPNGKLHSPYGATEALPVSTISSDEIFSLSGPGACVGRPLPGVSVRIIPITDDPIATAEGLRDLPPGEIGEIIVSGPAVTRAYDNLSAATAAAKIADGPAVWHRMGDCGYLDDAGRWWFCGRKAERVVTHCGTLFTEPCEQVFRQHPAVRRCALIGYSIRGHRHPALVAEMEKYPKQASLRRRLAREFRLLALQYPLTAGISVFFFHPSLPVDIRHNAKIHRLALARWAETASGYSSDPPR